MSTQVAPTPSGEHSEAPYLVASSEDALETKKLKTALEQFYAAHDKRKLKQGLDNIVDWTRRHGVDALNERLTQKYGKDLRSPKEPSVAVEEVRGGACAVEMFGSLTLTAGL